MSASETNNDQQTTNIPVPPSIREPATLPPPADADVFTGDPSADINTSPVNRDETRAKQLALFSDYYISKDDHPEAPAPQQPSSSEISPKTIPKTKKRPATDEEMTTPTKRAKTVPASSMAAPTPTRTSGRLEKKRKLAATQVDDQPAEEPESPLAKRSKTSKGKERATSEADEEPVDEPESPHAKRSKTSSKKRKELAISDADEEAVDDSESPLAKRSKTSKGKGKAPITPPTTDRPVRTRSPGVASKLRAERKFPKKHTPSSELAVKQKLKDITRHVSLGSDSDVDDDEARNAMAAHDSEDEEVMGTLTTKRAATSGKGKKAVGKSVIPHDFVGTHTGMGTSAERPEGAKLTKPWSCAHRNCSSGMTWHPRDGKGTEGFGRKSISNLFGRNKRETRYIPEQVWHTYCRKDYQRMFYKAVRVKDANGDIGKKGVFDWHMMNLQMQFARMKLWRPEAKFKVQLSKNMHLRSAAWHKALRDNHDVKDEALADYNAHPKFGYRGPEYSAKGVEKKLNDEQAFPVELVDQFDRDACGDDYTYDRIDEVMGYIVGLRDADSIHQMPPIEFLIHQQEDGETVVDPEYNYVRWASAADGMPFHTPAGSEADDDDEEADGDEDEDEDDEENEGSEIAVAASKSGNTLVDAIAAASDAEDESDNENDHDSDAEESDNDAPPAPINPPAKKSGFKLMPTNPKNHQRLSSTFGAQPGSGKKNAVSKRKRDESEEAAAEDTIEVKRRP